MDRRRKINESQTNTFEPLVSSNLFVRIIGKGSMGTSRTTPQKKNKGSFIMVLARFIISLLNGNQ